jgi:hypothetical protein
MQTGSEEQRKQERERKEEINRMSEKDLTESLGQHLRRMIAEQPEITLAALAVLGWTLIPPGGEVIKEVGDSYDGQCIVL